MRAHPSILLAALASLALAGCGGGRERPPSTEVTVIHAAPSYPDLSFLRSQRLEASNAYSQATTLTFDSDTYTFNIEATFLAGSEPTRLESFSYDVTSEERYLVVLAEVAGAIKPLVLAQPYFDVDSTSTEFRFVNAVENLPEADIYLEPPGTDITTAVARNSLGFLEDVPPATTAPGDYEITLTAPGDPSTVLFRSTSITFTAGDSLRFVIVDGAEKGTAPLYIVAISPASETSAILVDPSLPASVRAINAAADRLPRDLYVNDDFSAPLIGGLEFGAVSPDTTLEPGEVNITLTPAGNPSAIEFENPSNLFGSVRYDILIGGHSGETAALYVTEDFRSLSGVARFRLLNGVNSHDNLQVFLAEPGTDVTTAVPQFVLTSPNWSDRTSFGPGDYELTLRDPDSATVVYGPAPISLAAGGVYTIVAIDLMLLDGFD
jgi:hypothetical protein